MNVGFRENVTAYRLAEDAPMNTIIDRLTIVFDSFPFVINDDTDNLFFYTINDTSVPFVIDQQRKLLKLMGPIDRERQDRYAFEIELKLKSIYSMKLQERYYCQQQYPSPINFQYTSKFYQKLVVVVHITDVNDNAPRCPVFHAKVQLNENETPKDLVRIQASDPDLGIVLVAVSIFLSLFVS